jgi:hypothetical protein
MGSSGRTPKLPRQKTKLKAGAKKGKSWEEAAVDGSFRRSLQNSPFRKIPILHPVVDEHAPSCWLAPPPRPTKVVLADMIVNRQALEGFTLTPGEQYVVFAALAAMVADVHAVQDQMTDEQWTLAEEVYKRLTKIVDKRDA